MTNPIAWVEIPVKDIERAKTFYQIILDIEFTMMPLGPLTMALFPFDPQKPGAGGALIQFEDFYRPSQKDGPVVYFSCEDVASVIAKVETAGGKVLQKKKLIAEDAGYMGLIVDTEGNRVALHSNQ